ncbi:sugar phosphate isomerase/epimerase family protein [Agromyces larvae]|uniref:Sugar phosphate isomerase/epimerase n=1 Tax=Agromyces larvae TaxID=2929802 RepID=A0ABY4C300_9MICO|nr:sugar phosphate isomerase/epimerase family protein [Agromyces larvae]UOE45738.1 sugar phosphate isomerase/epimerase [Agromyces larvae]
MSDRPATTWRLTGFGDEIDPDPAVQLAVLQAVGAECIEVRSAWGVNIVDLAPERLDELAGLVAGRGMAVSAIASPVGKAPVELPVEHELERLGRAIAAAHRLDASYIRVFSFYRAEGRTPADVRDDVLERMSALARLAEREGVTLVHENEKEIYGDVPERVRDVVESVGSERLRVAWDNANFVQVGVRPYTDGYALLRPHLAYLQVKDAVAATGEVVPAGDGDGELLETVTALRDDGYEGFASLEPHLVVAGHSSGYSGPAGFGRAARAFRALTERIGVGLT